MLNGALNSREEVFRWLTNLAFKAGLDQVGDGFGVGIRGKFIPEAL